MRLPTIAVTTVTLLSLCWIVALAKPSENSVDYPAAFRSWQHVKTMIIQPGHPLEMAFGGIHHIYANEKAMRGLMGEEYKDGAVLVFDLLEYSTVDLIVAEGARKRLDVMQYDANKFGETGGWGFASFVGDEMVEQDVVTACYDCHIPAKETNFVYSQYRQ